MADRPFNLGIDPADAQARLQQLLQPTQYAMGGAVDCGCAPGYAKGGLKEADDLSQWLQLGGQDMESSPEGLPVGQFVGSSVAVPAGAGVADAFKLANQAYQGELPEDYFRSDEGVGRAFNAAATPMLGSFGLSHAVGPTVGAGETMLGMSVKPKGGNWIKGSIEGETRNVKSGLDPERVKWENEHYALEAADPVRYPEQAADANRQIQRNNTHLALDSWIDKKLNKYVQNELATPEDPVRLLAERGILHVNPENLHPTFRDLPGQTKIAESQAAKVWEDVADRSITTDPAKDYQGPYNHPREKQNANPWLEKLDPETPVYEVDRNRDFTGRLGFDHLKDELFNATRHDSDLPANLRLTPEKLDKVSVPQAVELVAKINKWREEAAARALQSNANNEATHLVKEYPDQGYRWVELKKPDTVSEEILRSLSQKDRDLYHRYLAQGDTPYEALQGAIGDVNPALKAALKYEGDMMGHCVGGYCNDVESGGSRIFSLRDSKGRPHVTIETGKNPMYEGVGNAINAIEPGLWEKMVKERGNIDHYEWLKNNRPDVYAELNKESVIQVKGKGNMAPKEEYLPFVQDFIKAGEWKKIHDLHNTGLYQVTPGQRLPGFAKEIEPGLYSLEDFQKMAVENEMPQDVMDMWMAKLRDRPRYSQGGSVQGSGAAEAADLDTLYQKYEPDGYAFGGMFRGLFGHIRNIWDQHQIPDFTNPQITQDQQPAANQDNGLSQLATNYGEEGVGNGGGEDQTTTATPNSSSTPAVDTEKPYLGGNLIMTEEESKQYDDLINSQQGGQQSFDENNAPLPPTKPAYLQNFDYSQYADPLSARYAYLSKALNPTIAAAAMGNFQIESGNNPNQLQTSNGTSTGKPLYTTQKGFENLPTGYGSAQWGTTRLTNLAANNPNKLGLYDFADRYGLDPNTTEGQDRFLVYELTQNPEYRNVYKNLLKSGNDVAGAVYVFGSGYETPKNLNASLKQRQQNALMYQNLYTNGSDKLTDDQRQQIADTQSKILDPYFNKIKADAEAKARVQDQVAQTNNDLGDVGFNPVVDTSVNDRIMADSNALLNQSLQNGLNYNYQDPFGLLSSGLTQYVLPDVLGGSGRPGGSGGNDGSGFSLSVPDDFPSWFSPYAEGGKVGFNPMFDGDSEIMQTRAKQLAKQAYTDPKKLSSSERREWNELAGKYNLPPSANSQNTYEEQTEETMTGLQKGLSSRQKDRSYARGGLVYDPDEIDAIAAQIRGVN